MTGWNCTGGDAYNFDVCTEICDDGIMVGNENCDDGLTVIGQ